MEASRAAGDGLHPRPSAPGGTHTGGCLRGVWALGAGRGKAAPPQPPSLGRPHGLGVACVGLVLAARVRRGTPVGRLSGGLRCCVRPMPICIVCAECLPVRNGKPSGACFDCDLLKHGQHKPRPSKVSAIPILGALASSPLPANMEASRAAGDGLHPRPSAPGGTHTGRVWSSSSSVARDPRSVARGWRSVGNPGMQGSRTGAGVCFWVRLLVARRLRKWRRRTGKSVRSLGFCSSVPNSCFVPNLRAYRGMLGRACCRSPAATLECVVGRRALACLLGHCVRNGRVSGDWRVWACWIPARAATTSPQAASVVGPSALLPWPRSVSCAAYPSRRHSIVPNVPFSPCAAPLGAAARGGPQGARCVPRPAHGRTCPGRWPIASSPDLSDAEHTVGTRPRPLFAPKASVRRFVRTTPATVLGSSHAGGGVGEECYLVDPASSHMLVSKIKPCMWMHLLDKRSTRAPPVAAMIHDNSTDRTALVPATHHSNFCPINFRWVRFRRGSLRNGYHIQGRQQARKLPNPDTGRIHWRASLVPAAAVIPAPIAWTLGWAGRSASGVHRSSRPFCRRCAPGLNWPGRASGAVTLKKLECSKQAYALYTLAWDNIIGFRSYYVGLRDRTFAKDVFINQERKLGARRRSDTVLVSTINDADQGSADVAFRTPPAPYEKSKSLGSGGSMVARLKLKGIDGRAPPGVEPAA
ncbi:UNVERIFIED_CONTAM: hypothetical protein Sindi_3000700 [Sesamum indicum]